MADLQNQENFNKIFSFFLGMILVVSTISLINKQKIIIVENTNF